MTLNFRHFPLTTAGLLAIEKLRAGDKVISTDPDTLETSEKTVLETYIRKVDRLVHLVINGEEIVTTDNHPFYVQGRGFIKAEGLFVGDKLISVDGKDLIVETHDIEQCEKPITVYNFKAEDYHTYFVGNYKIWVHNANCELKLANQMNSRGWTPDSVKSTVDNPFTTRVSVNKRTGNTATVFYTEKGSYVVVDDVTHEIIQVSENINMETWAPDQTIIDHYVPYEYKGG